MSKKTKFILAVTVQVAVLFTIIAFKVAILQSGADVLLSIRPVDPRDPFRGDYVTFRYDISGLPSFLFQGEDIKENDTVFVNLHRNGNIWYAGKVTRKKPDDGSIFIRGKITNLRKSDMIVDYGIEEYFITEGKGRNFSFWQKEALAKVTIDASGNAVIKQIYVDGKPWPEISR